MCILFPLRILYRSAAQTLILCKYHICLFFRIWAASAVSVIKKNHLQFLINAHRKQGILLPILLQYF